MLASRALSGRPSKDRPRIKEAFTSFLTLMLGDECVELTLVLDNGVQCTMGLPCLGPSTELDCNSLVLDVGTMLHQAPLDIKQPLSKLLHECDSYKLDDGTVRVEDLIMACVASPGWYWLARQLLLEVGKGIEMVFLERKFTQNACDVHDVLEKQGRWHEALRDALSLGLGPTDSGPASYLPAAHAETFMKFSGKRLRPNAKSCSINLSSENLLMRYDYNTKKDFKLEGLRGISLQADATRMGWKDILLVAVSVVVGLGEVLAAWAAPQVLMVFAGKASGKF